MKKLFIFARRFPYGNNEPYLETEIKYVAKFDEVHVFSLSVEKNASRREVYEAENVYYHTVHYQTVFKYLFALFTAFFSSHLYKELYQLIQTKKISVNSLKQLIIYLTKSKVESKEISSIISKKKLVSRDDQIVLYAYRFDYASYMISKLPIQAKKVVRVVRAHGIDLYEYRQSSNYLPFRAFILENIDYLLLISKGNMIYAKEKYPTYSDKFVLSYLGTNNLSFKQTPLKRPLQIISISSVVPVKRLDLILNAVTKASEDVAIHWTHYGANKGFNVLEKRVAEQTNNSNLSITLKGHVDNQQMLEELVSGDFHLFINLSTSEGLPVSIMEAMSVGIPAIATNAGGTHEIVLNQYTGFLLDIETTAEAVSEKIKEMNGLNTEDYAKLRYQARTHWEANFSAERNYKKFVENLLKLLDD